VLKFSQFLRFLGLSHYLVPERNAVWFKTFIASSENNQELKDLETEDVIECCQSKKIELPGKIFLKSIVSLAVWAVVLIILNLKSSWKMWWMLLSDKFKVIVCLNAELHGLHCTANITLSIFPGVWAICLLLEDEGLTLSLVVNLLKQLKIVFREGTWLCLSKLTVQSTLCNWFSFSLCD
jgi:hypothetical protein